MGRRGRQRSTVLDAPHRIRRETTQTRRHWLTLFTVLFISGFNVCIFSSLSELAFLKPVPRCLNKDILQDRGSDCFENLNPKMLTLSTAPVMMQREK